MYQDVEQLLLTHGIKYQKKGNVIKCLCPSPSHNDRHIGSFSFDTIKGVGHCFACGCSVNIFSFNKLLGEKLEYKGDVNYEFTKSLKQLLYKINLIQVISDKNMVTSHLGYYL